MDSSNGRVGTAEIFLSILAAIAVVVVIWAMSAAGGAVGIARADDWSYLLTQFEFHESGRFVMNNWAVTMLIGQTLLAAPVVVAFGASIVALQAFVATLSAAALVVTYVVVRQILPIRWSIFSLATLVVSPVFGPSVVSFMTDVPSLLFLSASLLVGIRAIQGIEIRWVSLSTSALLAVVAFSFRDYAIVCFVAVIMVALTTHKSRQTRVSLAAMLTVVVLVALGLYIWRHSLPNDLDLPGWDLGYSVRLVARGTLTVALLVSPALAAIAWWRLRGLGGKRTGGIYLVGLGLSCLIAVIAGFEMLGNVIHPFGLTWLISGSGIRMWPLEINRLLVGLAIVSLTLATAFAIQLVLLRSNGRAWTTAQMTWTRNDPSRAVLAIFPVLLLLAHSAATILLGAWYIDRYFILVIPFLAAALIRIAKDQDFLVRGVGTLAPIGVLLLVTLLGIHVVDFHARFDGSRWEIGRELVSQGYSAHEIDAGIEWGGFHALDIGQSPSQRVYSPDRTWWTERYPDQQVCVTGSATEAFMAGNSDREATLLVSTLFGSRYYLTARSGPDSCP